MTKTKFSVKIHTDKQSSLHHLILKHLNPLNFVHLYEVLLHKHYYQYYCGCYNVAQP